MFPEETALACTHELVDVWLIEFCLLLFVVYIGIKMTYTFLHSSDVAATRCIGRDPVYFRGLPRPRLIKGFSALGTDPAGRPSLRGRPRGFFLVSSTDTVGGEGAIVVCVGDGSSKLRRRWNTSGLGGFSTFGTDPAGRPSLHGRPRGFFSLGSSAGTGEDIIVFCVGSGSSRLRGRWIRESLRSCQALEQARAMTVYISALVFPIVRAHPPYHGTASFACVP